MRPGSCRISDGSAHPAPGGMPCGRGTAYVIGFVRWTSRDRRDPRIPFEHGPVEAHTPSNESELLGGGLAHLHLPDLAGDSHRELVDDLDVARDLVVRELSGAELPQRLGGQWRRTVL